MFFHYSSLSFPFTGAITVIACAMEPSTVNRHLYGIGKVLIASFQLFLGIFFTRLISIASERDDSRYGSDSFIVGLVTLTLHCLPPPGFMSRPQAWCCVLRHTAFGITFVLCITCGLGKRIHVSIAFRATCSVLHWLCHSHQQQAWLLPLSVAQVLVWALWFFVSHVSPNRNVRQLCHGNVIHERSVGFALICWATLYFICVSFTILMRSLQVKFILLSPPMHIHLVAYLQIARVVTKYIIVIKVNMPL